MAWNDRELNLEQVIEQLNTMLNYKQVEDFPHYEPKTRNEQLYVLDRLLRVLERGGISAEQQKSKAFQAAKRFVGRD